VKRFLISATVTVAVFVGLPFAFLYFRARASDDFNARPPEAPRQTPAFAGQTRAAVKKSDVAFDVVTITGGLEHPWGMAFLPDGRMLVTEKPGRMRVVSMDGALSAPAIGLPEVDARGQGGLLDVAIDPDFTANRLIYWSYAEVDAAGNTNTAVARGTFIDAVAGAPPRIQDARTIYRQTPKMPSTAHYGSRLVFARDGTLFVTQGERMINEGRMQAQRLDGLLGKVVRINPDGSIPADNPFTPENGARPEIWSRGHRNVQGAAINPATGELWTVEHGARGGDELNVVRRGKDYGWPTISYGIEYSGLPITGGIQQKDGMEQPVYYWDPVIAPSGLMFYTGEMFPMWKGNAFIGGLASQALVRLELNGDVVVAEERLLLRRGRVRDVVQGADGAIYILIDDAPGVVKKLVAR
jgi:glucose/arabinose dehydrogenase